MSKSTYNPKHYRVVTNADVKEIMELLKHQQSKLAYARWAASNYYKRRSIPHNNAHIRAMVRSIMLNYPCFD